jgi:metallophosphoesterase superfamily enzyme
MGNHDIHTHSKFCDIDIDILHGIAAEGFLLTHKPIDREGHFNFCGHIHPCIRLRGKARQFLKLPCFFRKPGQLILPAFGEFTGTFEMSPAEDDIVYAVTKDAVIEVN